MWEVGEDRAKALLCRGKVGGKGLLGSYFLQGSGGGVAGFPLRLTFFRFLISYCFSYVMHAELKKNILLIFLDMITDEFVLMVDAIYREVDYLDTMVSDVGDEDKEANE